MASLLSKTSKTDASDTTTPTPGDAAPSVAGPSPPLVENAAPGGPGYKVMNGRFTKQQLLAARDEYRRRVASGEEDVRVVVSKGVPARRWEDSPVEIHRNGCRVDVICSADMQRVDVELVDGELGAPHRGGSRRSEPPDRQFCSPSGTERARDWHGHGQALASGRNDRPQDCGHWSPPAQFPG